MKNGTGHYDELRDIHRAYRGRARLGDRRPAI